jgi:hypothetical protein
VIAEGQIPSDGQQSPQLGTLVEQLAARGNERPVMSTTGCGGPERRDAMTVLESQLHPK